MMPVRRLLTLLIVPVLALGVARAQDDPDRSTADGVYTRQQADAGRDLFALACVSCHAPTQHSGPPFMNKWQGRSLGELYAFIRREMPKNEPGTMSDDEYAALTAYVLRINAMPTGPRPLAPDTVVLHRIRIDTLKSVPDSTDGATRR